MAPKPLPAHDVLLQLLSYDPETGILRWKERGSEWFNEGRQTAKHNAAIWNGKNAGAIAGYTSVRGYVFVRVIGVNYLAHRIIWKMMMGDDPDVIDHVDGDKGNNRWLNLRSVTPSENNRNQHIPRDNTSGVIGVCWVKRRSKWAAQIKAEGRSRYIGDFDTFEEAVAARKAAEREHGFHENHGRAA